jgi:hypothetical protein
MPFFQKKPVVIEARQLTRDNIGEIIRWINSVSGDGSCIRLRSISQPLLFRTLEGNHAAIIGDWIIKGVKDQFYPCKPDIFEMTYQPVKEAMRPQENS